MIERKDVRHDYTGSNVVGCDKLTIQLRLMVELVIDHKELASCRFDLVDKLKQDNEEAIRRTLYGHVEQDLHALHQRMFRENMSVYDIGVEIEKIIAKLKWRD